MADKERDIINDRLINLPDDTRLFRINAGMGWTGKIAQYTGKMIVIKNPYPLHAAPTGWPDLCGCLQFITWLIKYYKRCCTSNNILGSI